MKPVLAPIVAIVVAIARVAADSHVIAIVVIVAMPPPMMRDHVPVGSWRAANFLRLAGRQITVIAPAGFPAFVPSSRTVVGIEIAVAPVVAIMIAITPHRLFVPWAMIFA